MAVGRWQAVCGCRSSVRLLLLLRLGSRSELAGLDVAMLDIAASRSLGESTAGVTVHNRIY